MTKTEREKIAATAQAKAEYDLHKSLKVKTFGRETRGMQDMFWNDYRRLLVVYRLWVHGEYLVAAREIDDLDTIVRDRVDARVYRDIVAHVKK